MDLVFPKEREGNLAWSLRSAVLAHAWLVERMSRPEISRTVGTTGSGKNKIARPKRLHPAASRPQIRTLGAIIYFDVSNPSGVCFNSFYLSCWPAIQDLNAPGLFLRIGPMLGDHAALNSPRREPLLPISRKGAIVHRRIRSN